MTGNEVGLPDSSKAEAAEQRALLPCASCGLFFAVRVIFGLRGWFCAHCAVGR